MNSNDISILLKKADELRSLFVLGQRVIPFLEEIFVFVQDIQPMLEEINSSIDENIQKMPGASEKLSKVTEANELATTEIMDTLDKLFANTDKLTKNNQLISENYSSIIDKPLRLLEILRRGIDTGGDLQKALPQIDNAIAKIKSFSNSKIVPVQEDNKQIINDINSDASAIMMSLQVQDITSQQIAAVDHMLSAIQGKLSEILKHFKNTDVTSLVDINAEEKDEDPLKTNSTRLHREIAFDPNAISSYDDNKKRQEEIDKIINSSADIDDILDLEDVSAEEQESDNLTGDSSVSLDTNSEAQKSESSEESEEHQGEINDDFDPTNPDDINAMFSGNNLSDDEGETQVDESTEENNSDDSIDTEIDTNSLDEESNDSDDSLSASQNQDDIDAMFNAATGDELDSSKGEVASSVEDQEITDQDLSEPQAQDDVDKMFAQLQSENQEDTEEEESEESKKKEKEDDFDLSKFDSLGDNPDPDDIDALFNGG